jgi:hypothetical protein
VNADPPFLFGGEEIGSRPIVSENIIVQFVGFQAKPLAREYTFTVRERETEPREYVIAINNTAFNSRRVRYQDAPDVCSHKLHRELAAAENHPPKSHFNLSDAELDEYSATHTHKPLKYPYAPKPDPEA